jgi:amino acid adenylation domain-containing protein
MSANPGSNSFHVPTLVHQFDRAVSRNRNAIAVECGPTQATYAELDAASRRLAHHLRTSAQVRPGDFVAICLEPGVDMVVAVLAILRCRAAYVPLDGQNPMERNRLILSDCRPRVLLGTADGTDLSIPTIPADAMGDLAWSGAAADDADDSADDGAGGPADVCYVIYTSGTTGQPKGVPITHANVLALFSATERLFDFSPDDAWLLYHSIAFDFSVWELWGALLTGARVVVVDRWMKLDPEACVALVVDRRVTVLSQTPTAFGVTARALLEKDADTALRYVVFGGERLTMAALRPWAQRHGLDRPALVNMYGLTEVTVHTTFHRVTQRAIGHPLPGLVARVVDASGRDSDHGELMVAGPQVASGYLHKPDLTAERFGPDPLGELDATFYRTGDLVKRRADGFVYIGRSDRQVKIRGHRIELGEIEAAISAIEGVAEASVLSLDRSDQPTLECAYTTHSGRPLPLRALRSAVRARLPQYMLPARFHWLAVMPLTVNGKTDVQSLKNEMELAR